MSALELACTLARQFEGRRLEAYHDPIGFPTQGYGRLLSRDKTAPLPAPIDDATAEAWLQEDMAAALRRAAALCPSVTVEGAQAALADFAFNLGSAALARSALRRLVNSGDLAGAAEQFKLWVHARGKTLPGLVARRAAERALFAGYSL